MNLIQNFLLQCIQAWLIPPGWKLETEPTMRNENQEFFDEWYAKLKDFLYNVDRNVANFVAMQYKKVVP